MQLPIAGHPLHTRSLTIVTRVEPDGRWRARGDVIDLRKCGFAPMVSDLQPAGIIHQMSIDLRIDPATRCVEALETDQPVVAIEASDWSRGECCRDPAPRLQALVGERLDADFSRRLAEVFGGPRGCSHLLTLFQLMASALPRGLELEDELQREQVLFRAPGERPFRRSVFVDGYEARPGVIELAVQLVDVHATPSSAVRHPLQRLARESNARVLGRVELPQLVLHDLQAGERERSADTLGSATWQDRSGLLDELVGVPILPGLARRLFGMLGGDPSARLLLDAALQLAPGCIQVMAALTDRWFERSSQGERLAAESKSDGPAVASVGGYPDSCYMWRKESPLQDARSEVLSASPGDSKPRFSR